MFLLRNRFLVAAITAIVVLGGITTLRVQANARDNANMDSTPLPTSVEVAKAVSQTITEWHNYSGRLEAVERVEIRSQVSGTLTQVHFKDGSLVEKGEPLLTIDPRPYEAAVKHAMAQVAATQARAAYTASDLARGKRLLADHAIAQRDYEEKRNASREAIANLHAAKATLMAAQLDLEHTQINAPISGRVSRAEVTPGNVITAGVASTPLTTLVSVAKMYASFEVDEQSFLNFINPARARNDLKIPVFLGLANEDGYPREGRLVSVDNRLDTSSGTIRVRAVFDNSDGMLAPGLYARLHLGAGAPHKAVLINEKAIGTDQDKRFVIVVDAANKTAYREVKIGAAHGDLRVVQSGLKAGEQIVVNGLQRIRPGDHVTPKIVLMAGASTPSATGDIKSGIAEKS